MNKLTIKIGVFTLVMGASMYGWAAGACKPIAKACMAQGGFTSKQELIKNCVGPVVKGDKQMPGISVDQRKACGAVILKKKMQEKMQARKQGQMPSQMQEQPGQMHTQMQQQSQ